MLQKVESVRDIESYIQNAAIPRADFSEYDIAAIWDDVRALQFGDVVVEIGVRFGKSLTAIALLAVEGVNLYGIDIEDPEGRSEYWKRSKLDTVATFIHKDSQDAVSSWTQKINFLHIDGDHRYELIQADLYNWVPRVKKGGVVYIHDYDSSSPGVIIAVDEYVKAHPEIKFEFAGKSTKETSLVKMTV